MKKKTELYKQWWFWLIIIGLFVTNVICAIKSNNSNANLFTAISGWVSAIATVVLGCIAVWQNKRYKELSDNMTDLMIMPDFFSPKAKGEQRKISGDQSYNQFEFALADDKSDFPMISSGMLVLINPPIINLKILKIKCSDKTISYNQDDGKSLFLPNTEGFSIKLQIPTEFTVVDNKYEITFEYENAYGNHYIKSGTFSINANATNLDNINFSKARRKYND